jgi:multiple sugar transport system ATP-binding protein
MRAGHVEQVGTPDTIYREPASTFVASFMGAPTMNLVPARLEPGEGGPAVVLGDLRLSVPPARVERYAPYIGRDIVVGLRPEHIAWAPSGAPGASPETAEITAGLVEPLGADTLVSFEIAGREMVCRVPPEAARRSGDRLPVRFDPSRMHLFDPTTERAI